MSPPSKNLNSTHYLEILLLFVPPLPFSIVGIVPSRNLFLFFPRRFSFYFRNFSRAARRRRRRRRRRSIWFIGGRRSLPRAEDCNFEAGGSFSHGFSSTAFALLLNVPPLLSRLSRLSRLTRLRESHSLIDNRRLATSVSGECFCQTASRRMSIASSIPSLTRWQGGEFTIESCGAGLGYIRTISLFSRLLAREKCSREKTEEEFESIFNPSGRVESAV